MEELAKIRRKIKKFSFDNNNGYSRLLIQLFGLAGNGKSSFINTCKYVWDDGVFINHTEAWSDNYDKDGGCTMERISYPLTKTITLVDNRGCKTMDSYETGELYAQLDDNARDITGIFPIVVLTHKIHGDADKMEHIFKSLGAERIFAFENYTPKNNMKTRGRVEDVLMFLYEVIKDVQFRVIKPINIQRDLIRRKEIVFNYIMQSEDKLAEEREKVREAKQRIMEQKCKREIQQKKANKEPSPRQVDAEQKRESVSYYMRLNHYEMVATHSEDIKIGQSTENDPNDLKEEKREQAKKAILNELRNLQLKKETFESDVPKGKQKKKEKK
ncbi:Hypothetical predicted protein [Pelobates cultripes]|uniref:Uncharacterized protein n=1 Tax=Pelobates cultripes TaxID=61616 RepID=A0AAD1SVA1_PELCU|nr:Hypothetical predicted protein [Pelobates cultripes]